MCVRESESERDRGGGFWTPTDWKRLEALGDSDFACLGFKGLDHEGLEMGFRVWTTGAWRMGFGVRGSGLEFLDSAQEGERGREGVSETLGEQEERERPRPTATPELEGQGTAPGRPSGQ